MVSSGLLRILTLSVLLVDVHGLGPRRSSNKCPRSRGKCDFRERDQCKADKQCPDNQKCCVFSCGKKCLDLKEDICSLPQDPGRCMAAFFRWWYDKASGACFSFMYGGCQGNNNNFQTKDLCLKMCSKRRSAH